MSSPADASAPWQERAGRAERTQSPWEAITLGVPASIQQLRLVRLLVSVRASVVGKTTIDPLDDMSSMILSETTNEFGIGVSGEDATAWFLSRLLRKALADLSVVAQQRGSEQAVGPPDLRRPPPQRTS